MSDLEVESKDQSKCNGCGAPLREENAWMEDGCPCNTPKGVNNGNQVISDWRQKEGNSLRHHIEQLKNELDSLKQPKVDPCPVGNSTQQAIESVFTQLLVATANQFVTAMQRVSDHRDVIVTAMQTQISREALNSGVVADALAEAIKALPPDKLIEFVKATEANVTQINIGTQAGAR